MNNHLERLIKQNAPFSSQRIKAQIGVLYLAYRYTSSRQSYFKQYNITLQQYNILRILRGRYPEPANISLLRERMLDKMSDTSRLVHRLYKQGYVLKNPKETDKRNADVVITEKALLLLEDLDKAEFEKSTPFDGASDEEVLQFNEIIDKMLSTL